MSHKISPSECSRISDVLSLNESTKFIGGYWMHVGHDGSVFLNKQRRGEEATASIGMSKAMFQRFLEWYETPQGR